MKVKFGLYDSNGDAITGSALLKCKIKRDADDYFFDFDDGTFKTSGHTSLASQMSEPSATNAPGEYEKSLDESAWDDGSYSVYCNYSGAPKQNGMSEIAIVDGSELNSFLMRLYQLESYKLKVTDATGSAKLRNKEDSDDIASSTITDDGTTTIRTKWSWS